MKKLKTVLSLALLLIISSVCLVACKSNNTTISLAEAKTIIVNALQIEQTQSAGLQVAKNSTENRNILEKLGSIKISILSQSYTYPNNVLDTEQKLSGYYQYSNGQFKKYNMESTTTSSYSQDIKEYSADCQTVFISDNGEISTATIQTNQALGYSASVGGMYIQVLDALFTDRAFDRVYKDTVETSKTENGYTMILSLDLKGYSRLLTLDSMSDEEFETWWEEQIMYYYTSFPQELKDIQKYTLSITFDNNDQIIDLYFSATDGSVREFGPTNRYYFKVMSSLKVSRYDGQITAPQWVEDYLAQ